MRSVRRFLVVTGTIAALTAIVPSVSAVSPKSFHLDKTCVSNFLCTVQSSTFKAIPAGTNITYVYNGDGSDGLAYPTIKVRNGSTTGVCNWNQPAGPVLAKCTFRTGTGTLTKFHLAVDVTVTGDPNSPTSVWHWDGTYWFGNDGHDGHVVHHRHD